MTHRSSKINITTTKKAKHNFKLITERENYQPNVITQQDTHQNNDNTNNHNIKWNCIKNDVQFLKKRLGQIFSKNDEKQNRKSITKKKLINNQNKNLKQNQKMRSKAKVQQVFGKQYTLQSIHLLYQQILLLRKQNQMLKQQLQQMQLNYLRQSQSNQKLTDRISMMILENKKLRNQFLQYPAKITRSLTEVNHEMRQRQEYPNKFPLKQTANFQKYIPKETKKIAVDNENITQRVMNLLTPKFEAQFYEVNNNNINECMNELKQRFQQLIIGSKYVKNKEEKNKLREKLFLISEDIRKLRNFKSCNTYAS